MVFKKGHIPWGKGKPCSEEVKRKISEANKGCVTWNKGIPCTEEFKKAHSKRMTGKNNPMYGVKRILTKEWVDKIVKSRAGYRHTQETRDKISLANIGRKLTEETRRKLRESHLERSNRRIGTFEYPILLGLEEALECEILRQYYVCGYSLDGYIPKLNLAIEIDEQYGHSSKTRIEKDKIRENNIKKELDCVFWRIDVPL